MSGISHGRYPGDEGEIHWIRTGPGAVGDFVTDEELEAAAEFLDRLKELTDAPINEHTRHHNGSEITQSPARL